MITISDLAGDYIKKLSTEKMNKYKEPQGRIVFAKASTLSDSNLNSDSTAEEKPSDTQASTPTDKQGDKQGDNAGDKSTKKPAEKKQLKNKMIIQVVQIH